MAQSLRKSLTAWLQLAALPPTPMRNSRPLRARNRSSSAASASIDANEISRQIVAAAAKKASAWFMRSPPVELSDLEGLDRASAARFHPLPQQGRSKSAGPHGWQAHNLDRPRIGVGRVGPSHAR